MPSWIGRKYLESSVQKNWCKVDSQQLAPYFKKCDPKLHRAISKVVGEDVVRDIYFARAWRGVSRKDNLVMEVVIADVFTGLTVGGYHVLQLPANR